MAEVNVCSPGCIRKLPTHPDSGPFHAALRHFSLKYVSIPAKKVLLNAKIPRCRSHWELEEYTLEHQKGKNREIWNAATKKQPAMDLSRDKNAEKMN